MYECTLIWRIGRGLSLDCGLAWRFKADQSTRSALNLHYRCQRMSWRLYIGDAADPFSAPPETI